MKKVCQVREGFHDGCALKIGTGEDNNKESVDNAWGEDFYEENKDRNRDQRTMEAKEKLSVQDRK